MVSTAKNLGYTEWLCHTNFSFLVGASHPCELFDQAQELGLAGLGITDFDGVYGLARSYRHWRSLPEASRAKLFYGAELHLTPDHELPVSLQNTVAFIAHSHHGYENLCKIINHSHRNGKYNAFIAVEDLASFSLKDLSLILPMRGLIRRSQDSLWKSQLAALKDVAGFSMHLAVSRHFNPAEDVWIPKQLAAAKEFDTKVLFCQDVFFHTPSRKPLSDTLHAIRRNTPLRECVDQMFVNDQRTLISCERFHDRYQKFACYQNSIKASKELEEKCQFTFAELRYHYPKEMIPESHTAQSYLEQLTWESAQKTYPGSIPDKVFQLLKHELQLIKTLHFADYFLTVWDIVSWARKENILCQGRGSAANSAVCFVLGITAVDPSRFDLLFERFMSVERGDPPDIDVDFENERREEVIQYIYRRYGRDKAAMVANVITFRRKGALRETGKALGIPEALLSEVSETIGSRIHAGKTLPEIVTEIKDEKPAYAHYPWQLWIELANELKGFPRHLGIHSGGFMLSDCPLSALVACEPATMEGRSVVQWCKDDIEDLGFFKIDILALGMLTAIRKMLAMIPKHYGDQLTLASIPEDDPATYQMIQRAETIGTFQIESRAQMSMLPRMLPKTFYDLVIEVAIIRPGPIQGGMIHPFLRRRHGLEAVTYPDERLRPILERTLGIPIFQEQVMRIAMAIGNFTPGEANELRKNMGAWSMRGDINPWLVKLAEGMKKNNIEPQFAEAIVAQMKGFAEYGFPESHSVSFALIAYASAYLKRHYPAAFFASLLNSQPMGFYSPHTLLQTAKREGVTILPISVNHSDWECTLETSAFGLSIRLGLRMISGLSETTGKHIESARQRFGPWSSWQDFLRQTQLYRRDLTILAAADTLKDFGLDRRSAIWMAAAAPHSSWLEDVEEAIVFAPESDGERIQQDFNATGTCLTAHPVKLIRESLWCYDLSLSKLKLAQEIDRLIPNQIIYVFGMISILQRPPSAKGMMFITLEDETGYINLAFTPDIIEKFAKTLVGASMLCVSGKVQRQGSAHSLLIREVYSPKITLAEIVPISRTPILPPPESALNHLQGSVKQRSRYHF